MIAGIRGDASRNCLSDLCLTGGPARPSPCHEPRDVRDPRARVISPGRHQCCSGPIGTEIKLDGMVTMVDLDQALAEVKPKTSPELLQKHVFSAAMYGNSGSRSLGLTCSI